MQISNSIPAVALVAAALFFSLPASAQTPDAATAEFDRLLDAALGQQETTVALAQVGAATRLANFVTRDHYAAALDAAAKAARDPVVAFALHQKAAWAFAEMKDARYGADGMSGPLADQGCLRDFAVVGPFDNPAGQGFHGALGPELGEVGPYQGKLTEVNWRPLPRHDRYCEFNLNQFVQPPTAAAAYLATEITAPQAKKSTLLVGADGAYKVWLNGELVAQRDEDAGMSADNDAWSIALTRGTNDLLIKVGSGQDGGLGIVARVVDAKLRPFEFETVATWNRVPVRAADSAKPEPGRRGVLAEIEANAKKLRGDDAAWNAWLWKSANRPNVAVPWRDVAQRLVAEPDDLTPRMHALLAELYEEHWERLAILAAASERAPEDPWVGVAYAAELENSIAEAKRLRTRELYQKWAAAGFLPAVLDLADWYKRNALSERALTVLEALERPDRHRIPGVIARLAALHEDIGSLDAAMKLEEQVAAVMYLSGGHVWEQLRDALVQGAADRALSVLDEYQRFVPASQYARTRRAEILRARGDVDAAIAIYDALIAQSPGDSDLYEDKARLQIAANRRDGALATLQREYADLHMALFEAAQVHLGLVDDQSRL